MTKKKLTPSEKYQQLKKHTENAGMVVKEKEGKIILLLIGGDKSTQQKDIKKAKEIWKNLNK